jgi:hypothetical protein
MTPAQRSIVILPMPYGCLDSDRLSAASLRGLELALERWQKSMQTARHKTFLVLAGYEDDSGLELRLRKEILLKSPSGTALSDNVVEITAKDEEELAQRITRTRAFLPIETLTIFAESRHALSIRAIFRRRFGKALEIKKFKADFEFNHPWISASSSAAWLLWILIRRAWFGFRKRMGRGLRKRLRYLFWS